MVEINIETIAKVNRYSVPQLKRAVMVASVLQASVENFGHFLLLEPPEKP